MVAAVNVYLLEKTSLLASTPKWELKSSILEAVLSAIAASASGRLPSSGYGEDQILQLGPYKLIPSKVNLELYNLSKF